MIFRDIDYIDEDFTVKHGCITIEGDLITAISESMPQGDLSGFGEIINGAGKLLMPGLVNSHCHVPMTLLRGYGEGLPLDRWLNERVFPFEDKITPDDTYWGTLLGIAEMLRSGVTSFTEMYALCGSICEAVELSGIKINISQAVLEFSDGKLSDNSRFKASEELINTWNGAAQGRIVTEASIHAEYTSNPEIVSDYALWAKSRGVGMHLHLSETESEHIGCKERHSITPAAYFDKLGVFDMRTTAAHCVWVETADIATLAGHDVTATHCPSSNMKLGSGFAPIPAMLRAGVNVALGTDGASSNNNLNLFEEMHLAGLIHKGYNRDASLLPAAEVLKMATVNGARGQGRTDTGLIKEGYKADLVMLDIDKPHLTPRFDFLSNLVFSAQSSDIVMTVVDGRIVCKDGHVLTFDVSEAIEKAFKAAMRIADEL